MPNSDENPNLIKSDRELVEFLTWCLPKLRSRWPGFRKVRKTVRKRLTRRIRDLGLTDLTGYRDRLEANPEEWAILDSMCRIPISRFYRDRQCYDVLAQQVLPDCAARSMRRGDGTVRVLSAGCASGEEPFSVSLIWHLQVADEFPGCAIDILAVDIDDVMLTRAQAACYTSGALKDLPDDLRAAGFKVKDGGYWLLDRFRDCVRLRKVDLRDDFPAGRFDVILCRNVAFTYFDKETQVALMSRLEQALRPGGYLIIGSHETLPTEAPGLKQLDMAVPLYRKPDGGFLADIEK